MDITEIWKFELRRGNSGTPSDGACLLDAVSWLEYGTLGDHPECVCPVIAAYGRAINDAMSDSGRQKLKAFIPRLIGTVDKEHELERATFLTWQATRIFAPLALDAISLCDHAAILRNSTNLIDAAHAAYVAAHAASAANAAKAAAHAASAAYAASAANATKAAAYAAASAAKAAAYAVASAAAYAAANTTEQAMIDALEGVLLIGRQAEPIEVARHEAAINSFDAARAHRTLVATNT